MSTIRKRPFIEEVVKTLSDEDLTTLKYLVNTSTVNIPCSITNMPAENGVYAVDFSVENGKIYSSLLIKNNTYTALIAYHRFQDLLLFKIVNNKLEKVNEYSDINELRRIIDDVLVGSGDADAGEVLTADGAGGTEWKNPADSITGDKLEAGAIVSVFGFNADGEPVKGEIPSGSVIDAELDEDSTNPVQNKVVTEEFDKKANKDGNYSTMTVGLADNLTPYSDDSGALQEKPFISQGAGTNNNTEIVTVGDYGLLKSKNGNTVVVNQQVRNGNFLLSDYWSISGGTLSISDGKARASANDGATLVEVYQGELSFIKDHKYLRMVTVKSSVQLDSILLGGIGERIILATNSTGGTYFAIRTANANQQYFDLYLYKTSFASGDYIDISNCYDIDLTQMFNGNIPQDLLDNPSHFSWYYNGSLAYNTGELVNASGRYLTSTGRQLWDEEWELGLIQYDKTQSNFGQNISSASNIRSKNYIEVIPNTVYYGLNKGSGNIVVFCYDKDKNPIVVGDSGYLNITNTTFTTPSSCHYIRFYCNTLYGTTYNNDITISLYYSPEQGGEGYNQYYPYEAPYVVDTGSEVLLAFDKKYPSGVIERNTNKDNDLSQASWSLWAGDATNHTFVCQFAGIKNDTENEQTMVCSKYTSVGTHDQWGYITNYDKAIMNAKDQSYILVHDTAYSDKNTFIASLSNVELEFKKATPTTEQGTPYSTNLPINDYGMMYWDDNVPQGVSIFYPINYKGFLDDLYSRVNGDSSGYALESELTASETERDTVDTQLKNAIGGTLRQCLCVKESLDFNDTDVVDLGTLTGWNTSYISSGRTYVSLANASLPASNSEKAKILCSLLQTDTYENVNGATSSDLTIALGVYGFVQLKWTARISSSTDTSAKIQAALKGVLLAYKKAGN